MCFVSIIIPVFNTEQYLSRCLDSLLNQSFTDYELLLVDDGSSDTCGAICDAYAARDGRIRVFHKENGGVSSARNLGLDFARGEWVYFVDSDDELLPDGLKTLIDCISDEVDSVMGGIVEIDVKGIESTVEARTELSLSKKRTIVSLYNGYGSYYNYCGYMCIWLLRRRVISEHRLRFDSSIAIKEDTLFLMQFVCQSDGITRQTTVPVYRYYKRADSAMGSVSDSYNSKYVDSFYALVKMKHEIETLYPFYSSTVFIAKQAIVSRYYSIVRKMERSKVLDTPLIKEIRSVMCHEVGSLFLFRVRRKGRKLLRVLRVSSFI